MGSKDFLTKFYPLFTRLSVKPWSVIQALHQQRTQTHDSVILNLKGAEFASHFFSSYSLVALIPAALNDLGKGSLLVDLDKLQHILSLTMAVLQLCSSIKPVVFAEPVIRRVKIWAWTLRLGVSRFPSSSFRMSALC